MSKISGDEEGGTKRGGPGAEIRIQYTHIHTRLHRIYRHISLTCDKRLSEWRRANSIAPKHNQLVSVFHTEMALPRFSLGQCTSSLPRIVTHLQPLSQRAVSISKLDLAAAGSCED